MLIATRYRENRFAFRKPSELIMFLNAIGWINMARMDFKENLAVSSNFFSKYKHSLELKWMARWHPELRSAMKGITLFTPDWDPKDFDEDYKPPEIEMALKTMILVMEEIEQLNQALNKPHMSPRFKTMDLTECFITIASQLQSLGMGDMSQSEVGEYTSELAGVDEEGNLLEVKDKGKGKEKEIDPVEGHNGHTEVGWGYWTLDAASGSQGFFERFYENDNGDTRSEDSGYYTPSIHVENGKPARHVYKQKARLHTQTKQLVMRTKTSMVSAGRATQLDSMRTTMSARKVTQVKQRDSTRTTMSATKRAPHRGQRSSTRTMMLATKRAALAG